MHFGSVKEVEQALRGESYLPDRGLATAIFLSVAMGRPLLLEGEAGVGKTEVGKTLSRILGADLIRLQCYEGIDASQALYEWDYSRQLLHLRAIEAGGGEIVEDELYSERFLVRRPLLRAIGYEAEALGSVAPPVLLIDEIDRADDEFEAFLLELLSDFQITIPEIGTIVAEQPPLVVLTSNRTRELHDALKRRCLYHWVGFPTPERELEIVQVRAPGVSMRLAEAAVAAVHRLREMDLAKPPGVAETIDWVQTLEVVGAEELEPEVASDTLGAVIKDRDDLEQVREDLGWVTSGA